MRPRQRAGLVTAAAVPWARPLRRRRGRGHRLRARQRVRAVRLRPHLHRWADNTLELKNQATTRCIDDSNLGFRTLGCNAGQFQSWF
ncbi:hypothetical protein [Streptomyces longwoodensis]|uniref:hypothetical protein n=1 Tax=Streptomyces longwoodensis TaxID=68231 RepID=UPI0030DEDBEC